MNPFIRQFWIFTIIVFGTVACSTEYSSSGAKFSPGWSSYTNANEITDLAFEQNGYLWAASVGGVTRWNLDTGAYERYTIANGLPSNNVTAIQPALDGSVWIGTQYGQIARLREQKWEIYEIPELSRYMEITDIHQDKSGNIWFSTRGAGAIRYDGKAWKTYLLEDGIASVVVNGIVEDGNGNLWFETRVPCCQNTDTKNVRAPFGEEHGIKYGVSRYDGENWKIYIEELNLTQDDFTFSYYSLGSSGNHLWIYSYLSRKVFAYDGSSLKEYPFEGPNNSPVVKIFADDNGNTWFFGYNLGVKKFDGMNWDRFDEESGLLSNNVSSIAIRADGTICFGTEQGISCLTGADWLSFRTTDVESSLPSMHINDLTQGPDGIIWLATHSGVVRFNGQEWKVFSKDDDLPVNVVRNISVDSDGIVWIRVLQYLDDIILSYDGEKWKKHDYRDIDWFIDFSQDGGFWALNYEENTFNFYNGQQQETYPPNPSISNPEKVIVTPDSQIWVFQPYEVLRFNGKTWDMPYPYNSWTTGMTISPSGNIWLASDMREKIEGQQTLQTGLGFQSFNGTNWDLVTSLPDKSWVYRNSIVFSSNGVLWVCVDDGVYKYFNNEWTRYTIQDGLSGNSATAIYSTPNGVLWFVTEGGLTLYNDSD